jgi:hypothetical protein
LDPLRQNGSSVKCGDDCPHRRSRPGIGCVQSYRPKYLSADTDREAAVKALLRIHPRDWPKDAAPALLDGVMKYIRSLPVAERTSPVALDMMQLGEGLAGLLPAEQARAARKELSEIGVRVIRRRNTLRPDAL